VVLMLSARMIFAVQAAEELLLRYEFSGGSALPDVKATGVYAGNEFGVFNTTALDLQMTLQPEVDFLSVKNNDIAVKPDRYGYISLGVEPGYTAVITRVEIVSRKGNDNTLNARCYLYDTLKNNPTIISNMIYTGTNAGYPIPVDWERKSFAPLAGPLSISDTVYFSFTSTQKSAEGETSDWQIDELAFYGTLSGGDEVIKDVHISIDAHATGHEISPWMNGSHFVYGSEADRTYQDERIADWMRSVKTGMIRWPGGTAVMSYHWDALTGDNFGPDRWDLENYTEQSIDPSNYMDLDEFITYCRRVNALPLVGVNIHSGKTFSTDAAGLDEARRLIQYCVDQGYNVKHWYIGNEGYAKGYSPALYAQYIDKYATELKKVDPDITIIGDWKFGPEDKNRYSQILTIIQLSKQLDVMEVHEKWGNDWGVVSGTTVADWKSEFPIYNGKLDYFCKKFHTDVQAMGKHTKLGMNEWGIGGMVGGNIYQYALLAADLMTQMFKNDVYSACYWNLNIGNVNSRIFTTNAVTKDFNAFNPIANVFKMYTPVLGTNYLSASSDIQKIYGIASINHSKDTMQVLLLNKSPEKYKIKLSVDGFTPDKQFYAEWFDELGISEAEKVEPEDLSYVVPPYSFVRLELTGNTLSGLKTVVPLPEHVIVKKKAVGFM